MPTPDSWYVVIAQAMFYSGLLMLMVGLPVFLWFVVRACLDLHAIRLHLDGAAGSQEKMPAAGDHQPRPQMLSAFGR